MKIIPGYGAQTACCKKFKIFHFIHSFIHPSIDSMAQTKKFSLHRKFVKTWHTCDLETTVVMQLKSRNLHKSKNIKALASSLDHCLWRLSMFFPLHFSERLDPVTV